MIFSDKYNNSVYTMCEIREDFKNMVMDYIMDLPTEILKKVQKGKAFEEYEDDNYVIFTEIDNGGVVLESCFFGKKGSLMLFPFSKEELNYLDVMDDNDDLVDMIEKGKE